MIKIIVAVIILAFVLLQSAFTIGEWNRDHFAVREA